MRRFLVSLIWVVTLAVTYRVYSSVLLPLTEVRTSERPLEAAMESDLRGPAVFEQQAIQIFPDKPWTHQAQQTWQMAESAYLYFNEYDRVAGAASSILISPVAIFWQDPKRPDEKPYRVLAERAQIKFQNSFFDSAISLSSANPGRIVWASLEGVVHIDGPDGLVIDGQNFKFDEESSQLYSDHSIAFSFGPTAQDKRQIAGTADQLQLTFEPASESVLGKDLPRVGGLAQILLRRNVVLDMSFEQKGEPRVAQIRSAGAFLYDLLKREATLDDQVRVVHVAHPGGTSKKDAIDCEWLRLEFDQAVSPENKKENSLPSSFDGMTFRSLRAQGSDNGRGSRMKITSDDQQVSAVMQDLTYDAIKRRAILIDQEQVVIHRGNAKFVCPQIGVQHSETNQIEYLECRGPGQMDVRQNDPDQPPMMARWAGRVQVSPDPQAGVHQVQIEDDALLGIPGQFGVAADTVRIWVDLERVQQTQKSGELRQTSGTRQDGLSRNVLADALPLKRFRAENHVRLDSAMLKVDRSQLIDVVVHPGLIDNVDERSSSSGLGQRNRDQQQAKPWIISADQLKVDLVHDSSKAAIDLRQVTGTGNILIEHDPGEATNIGSQPVDGPLTVKGVSLFVQNDGGVRQVLTVRGEMNQQGEILQNASIGLGPASLWGGHITLSRHENRVDVPGPGGLTVPLTQSITGGAGGPTKMDIVWQEGMSFDGQTARFWGKVTTAVPGQQQSITRLLCEDLSANLNQQISFVDPEKRNAELGIQSVEARHNIVVEAFEYAQNRLAAVRRSELARFHVDIETGDFRGDGPGSIHSWSLGDAVKFSPGESPQANQPAKPSDTKWRYTNVRFAGSIDGNINRTDATLRDRVEVLTAPVEKALAKFQREQLSDATPEAANAAWMKCRQMRIIQKQSPNQSEKSYEVFATGGTELEGHVFRAVADEMTFDERYGLFTLRGLGKEAHLYHQTNPGQPVNPFAASQIKFVPVKREIVIDGSSGISGSY